MFNPVSPNMSCDWQTDCPCGHCGVSTGLALMPTPHLPLNLALCISVCEFCSLQAEECRTWVSTHKSNVCVCACLCFCVAGRQALKAGTHRPNRWMSEVFGETQTRSGTNMFGVFSCVGSFRSCVDVVGSDWTYEVWGGWLSDVWAIGYSAWLCASWMAVLIDGVLANQRSVWEGRNTVCALIFYALHHSLFSCFAVLAWD